jgi:fatty acid desaturase 2 (delta-6 desaturase)
MGKGTHGVPGDTAGQFTWEEVRGHTKADDKWIVIGDKVYDISKWARHHPGGSRIISHYAGQDATEAFHEFHPDMKLVTKYMNTYEIGKLSNKDPLRDDEEIKKDFVELRKTAEQMGLFEPSTLFFVLVFAHLIFFEALAYYTIYTYGTGWLPYSFTVLFYVIALSQAGWSQHDYGHLSVFKSNWMNHLFHSVVMNLIKGASTSWWQHLHNQHHSKPNVINKDPDVHLDPMFVVGEEIPKRLAQKKNYAYPYNWQQYYFFAIGPPLLFPLYFQYRVFKHPISRGQYLDVLLMSLFYIKLLVLYWPFLGLFGAIKFLFLVRCLESHWFVWVSQSNHIPMDIEEDKERPWLALQLYATCNVEKSLFNDWFTGHLNFQIEHHLFPTMPRHNLYKIQPQVRALCAKHRIPYKLKSLPEAFGDIVRSLKRSGEVWEKHYRQLHRT